MQIEVEISLMKVQLDQKCKNYAIKVVELSEKHSIRKRTLISYSSQYATELNLNLNASKYLNWNESMLNLSQKFKNCKDKLTQIYWILNKVHKTLNLIQKIKISHFKESWGQEIEYLTKLQIEFAKSETRETINMHYRFFFYFFIKCMQSMTMILSRRCMYAKLYVTWSKSLLYIFSLINHIDSLHIQALSLKFSQSYFRFSSSFRTLRVLLFRS